MQDKDLEKRCLAAQRRYREKLAAQEARDEAKRLRLGSTGAHNDSPQPSLEPLEPLDVAPAIPSPTEEPLEPPQDPPHAVLPSVSTLDRRGPTFITGDRPGTASLRSRRASGSVRSDPTTRPTTAAVRPGTAPGRALFPSAGRGGGKKAVPLMMEEEEEELCIARVPTPQEAWQRAKGTAYFRPRRRTPPKVVLPPRPRSQWDLSASDSVSTERSPTQSSVDASRISGAWPAHDRSRSGGSLAATSSFFDTSDAKARPPARASVAPGVAKLNEELIPAAAVCGVQRFDDGHLIRAEAEAAARQRYEEQAARLAQLAADDSTKAPRTDDPRVWQRLWRLPAHREALAGTTRHASSPRRRRRTLEGRTGRQSARSVFVASPQPHDDSDEEAEATDALARDAFLRGEATRFSSANEKHRFLRKDPVSRAAFMGRVTAEQREVRRRHQAEREAALQVRRERDRQLAATFLGVLGGSAGVSRTGQIIERRTSGPTTPSAGSDDDGPEPRPEVVAAAARRVIHSRRMVDARAKRDQMEAWRVARAVDSLQRPEFTQRRREQVAAFELRHNALAVAVVLARASQRIHDAAKRRVEVQQGLGKPARRHRGHAASGGRLLSPLMSPMLSPIASTVGRAPRAPPAMEADTLVAPQGPGPQGLSPPVSPLAPLAVPRTMSSATRAPSAFLRRDVYPVAGAEMRALVRLQNAGRVVWRAWRLNRLQYMWRRRTRAARTIAVCLRALDKVFAVPLAVRRISRHVHSMQRRFRAKLLERVARRALAVRQLQKFIARTLAQDQSEIESLAQEMQRAHQRQQTDTGARPATSRHRLKQAQGDADMQSVVDARKRFLNERHRAMGDFTHATAVSIVDVLVADKEERHRRSLADYGQQLRVFYADRETRTRRQLRGEEGAARARKPQAPTLLGLLSDEEMTRGLVVGMNLLKGAPPLTGLT